MQQRASFENIKTDDPDLFAVRIGGHLATTHHNAVEAFLARCKSTGKSRVLFELSELSRMGGGIAQIFGSFAAERAVEGHPTWFVGANPMVAKFLRSAFGEVEPSFAETMQDALASMGAPSDAGQQDLPKTPEPDPVVGSTDKPADEAVEPQAEGDDFLNIIDAVNAVEDEESESDAGRGPSTAFLSLAEGLEQLADVRSLAGAEDTILRLLNSSSLAARASLFVRLDDRFLHGGWALAADGVLSTLIEGRKGPVDLIDLFDLELDPGESEVLEKLNCQVCVPFFQGDTLEGLCFLAKFQAGEEYTASESFALELLSRQVSEVIWPETAGESVPKDEKKPVPAAASTNGTGRLHRSLQRIARQLHESLDEDSILSRLALGLIGEMGVAGVVSLELDEQGMHRGRGWGLDILGAEGWADTPAEAWDTVSGPVELESIDTPWANELRAAGCSWFAPLSGNGGVLRGLGLALKPGQQLNDEALDAALAQAGYALAHSDHLAQARSRTMVVTRTLVSLIEKRMGHGSGPGTDLVAQYSARVATGMNFDKDEIPDLLYGTILRDVGMIEISDLVLKSPRKLSPEEWKLVQRHPVAGVEILRGMGFGPIACDVVMHHHERYNGQGYPGGLRGTAIPIGARIVSVAESYVAMLRDTPYRPALSEEEALAVLQENWEMRYDPGVIEAFVAMKQADIQPEEIDLDSMLAGQVPA